MHTETAGRGPDGDLLDIERIKQELKVHAVTDSADAAGPMRARDLCERLDCAIMPKNIESTRHNLKRLVGLGVLTEPEAG
ncbi:hypothetical protein ACFVVX_12060 [Kitasatospora sp. NPDC058170]|uniref:hypothetical protein n=1 Tax=Kitasatospora sp. NPDC058170 TaxID=3346364 RepID=UPI0036DEE964